tara:strand:+ start:30389 stop:31150 length:762 start_codon:yes stop_codon:yes gene_type:complete
MNLFDTHCHINLDVYDNDRELVLSNAKKNGVSRILVPAIRYTHWDKIIELSNKNINLYPALGLHPLFAKNHAKEDLVKLEQYIKKQRLAAIGEIGLDFFHPKFDKKLQEFYFQGQLELAQIYNLPVIIHARKTHENILKIIKKYSLPGGICHAFNGSIQQAVRYIDLGFKLGFGGSLTYKNSRKIQQLATQIPIESIVLETDAPDMVGSNHRYQRNSPEYLPEVAEKLSELKKISLAELAEKTTFNGMDVLKT